MDPDKVPVETSERPTWVRWRLVALLMAFSFMSWFNRISMSAAADERIMAQYSISPEAMGTVYSAFLLVYAAFMTPGGWFIDRYGTWAALTLMGIGSGVFCALTGSVGLGYLSTALILPALFAVRALMGLFSAPIYPASGRVVSHWVPFPQRAFVNGLVTAAAPLGGAATYLGFGYLIDRFDWPTAFLISGLITGFFGLLWAAYATNRPGEHRSVNPAEQAWIGDQPAAPDPPYRRADSWWPLLSNRSLVLLTLSYGAVSYFEYLFFFWTHHYFEDVLKIGKMESRYYAGVLNLSMAGGMALGGWLSDRLQQTYGYHRGRAIVPVGGMLGSAGLLLLGIFATEPMWIVTWFSLAVAFVGACEGPYWATAIELGGRRGGTSAGICNTGGNAGGLVAPIVTPWVSGLFGWPVGIGLGSVVCLLGACSWWWIDPAERCDDGSPLPTGETAEKR